PGYQLVFAKRLFVKVTSRSQAGIQFLVVSFIKFLYINSEFVQNRFCNLAVFARTLNRLRPAIRQQESSAHFKFVTPRVSAEIVMAVENQNARAISPMFAIKMRCRKPADSRSHDDEVV